MSDEKRMALSDDELEMISGGKNINGKEMNLVMRGTRPKSKSAVYTGQTTKVIDLVGGKDEKPTIGGDKDFNSLLGPGTPC